MSKTRTVVGISIVIAVALVAAATVQPAAQSTTATQTTSTANLDVHNAADDVVVQERGTQVKAGQVRADIEVRNTGQSPTTVTVQVEAYRGSELLSASVEPNTLDLAPSESHTATAAADTVADRIEVYVEN